MHVRFADLNRLRQILIVVLESGGGMLLDRLRLKYLLPFRYHMRRTLKGRPAEPKLMQVEGDRPVLSPPALRALLERLGPTFIKLGQILSMRADLIGAEISEELAKLQSNARPFPYEIARKIVKEELGQYPETVFSSFERESVAAASLAQVHRAFLPDGTEVAVKIQRPGIQKTIEQDIRLLAFLASLTERFMPELRTYQPTRVVREFADWTHRELDFVTEGRNAERFRYIFKENPEIYIPRVYWRYTTSRVLAVDFSHGVKVNNFKEMNALSIDRKKLATIGVDAFFRQFFIAGFFHADPHPGNFFAMPDAKLCLHDFGMVGYLPQTARREILSCLVAFVNKDIEAYTKHLLHLATTGEQSDIAGFEKDVAGVLSEFFFSERPPSVAWAFFRVINLAARRGIRFPADLALFGKALVTTEGMGTQLYPEFAFNEELEPYVRKALKESFSPARVLQKLETDLVDHLGFLIDFPEQVQRVLTKIEKGEVKVKLDAEDLQGMLREFDRQNDLRLLGIILTVVALGTIALLHLEGKTMVFGIPLSGLGMLLFGLFLLWFVIRLRQGPEK